MLWSVGLALALASLNLSTAQQNCTDYNEKQCGSQCYNPLSYEYICTNQVLQANCSAYNVNLYPGESPYVACGESCYQSNGYTLCINGQQQSNCTASSQLFCNTTCYTPESQLCLNASTSLVTTNCSYYEEEFCGDETCYQPQAQLCLNEQTSSLVTNCTYYDELFCGISTCYTEGQQICDPATNQTYTNCSYTDEFDCGVGVCYDNMNTLCDRTTNITYSNCSNFNEYFCGTQCYDGVYTLCDFATSSLYSNCTTSNQLFCGIQCYDPLNSICDQTTNMTYTNCTTQQQLFCGQACYTANSGTLCDPITNMTYTNCTAYGQNQCGEQCYVKANYQYVCLNSTLIANCSSQPGTTACGQSCLTPSPTLQCVNNEIVANCTAVNTTYCGTTCYNINKYNCTNKQLVSLLLENYNASFRLSTTMSQPVTIISNNINPLTFNASGATYQQLNDTRLSGQRVYYSLQMIQLTLVPNVPDDTYLIDLTPINMTATAQQTNITFINSTAVFSLLPMLSGNWSFAVGLLGMKTWIVLAELPNNTMQQYGVNDPIQTVLYTTNITTMIGAGENNTLVYFFMPNYLLDPFFPSLTDNVVQTMIYDATDNTTTLLIDGVYYPVANSTASSMTLSGKHLMASFPNPQPGPAPDSCVYKPPTVTCANQVRIVNLICDAIGLGSLVTGGPSVTTLGARIIGALGKSSVAGAEAGPWGEVAAWSVTAACAVRAAINDVKDPCAEATTSPVVTTPTLPQPSPQCLCGDFDNDGDYECPITDPDDFPGAG